MFLRIAQIGLLGFCMWIVAANAEPGAAGSTTTKPNDTSNIPEIQRIIQTHQLSLSDAFLERAGGHPDIVSFCETFLTDLKAGRVEYIKPVLITNDPNHPELKRFQSCRNNVHTPEELKQGAGVFRDLAEIGTQNFRLYRLDLDGNPDNGLEEVVYGEKERLPTNDPAYRGALSLFGSYAQVTTKTCTLLYRNDLLLRSEFDGTTDGKSALIRYREAANVMSLWRREVKSDPKRRKTNYVIDVWGDEQGLNLPIVKQCSFITVKED